MEVKEISKEEFTNFTTEYTYSSVLQTYEYAEVMENQGYKPLLMGIFDNDTIVGASLILIKKIKGYQYAYAPRGFLMDYSDKNYLFSVTKEIKKFLSKRDVMAIKIAPPLIKDILNKDGQVIGINPSFDTCMESLKVTGYHHFGFNTAFEAYKPRFEALIDLTASYNDLFKNIKKEYKTKIRSAEKNGIRIYRANSNEIDYIYEQTKSKYPRDLKYFQDSYKFFGEDNKMEYFYAKLDTSIYLSVVKSEYEDAENQANMLNAQILKNPKDNNKLLSKKMEADKKLSLAKEKLVEANRIASEHPKGLVLASMLIAKNRTEVYLYMDGYDVKYKSFNAKHILMWKIIEKYASLGYKRLNLGGVTDIRIENDKYKGLNEFKTNFNASIVEYAGDFELIVNQAKYFLYRQLGGKK